MNFSLTVEHRLIEIDNFFFDRYTLIDFWVGDSEKDYFRIEDKKLCDSEAWETYYVNMTEEDQMVELETNGEISTLSFSLLCMPGVTNSDIIHILMELLPGYPVNCLEYGNIQITIYPVQC